MGQLFLQRFRRQPKRGGQRGVAIRLMHEGTRAPTTIAPKDRRDRQALGSGQPRGSAAFDRREADRCERAIGSQPQMPGLLAAAVRARGSPVGRELEVDRQPREVRVACTNPIAQRLERFVQGVRVHRGSQAVASSRQLQRPFGIAAPDVDRQVVAHLVDQQVGAVGAVFIGPAVVAPRSAQEDAHRVLGQEIDQCREGGRLAGLRRLAGEHHRAAARDDGPQRGHHPQVDAPAARDLDDAHRLRRRPVVAPPSLGESGEPGGQGGGHGAGTVPAGRVRRNRGDARLRPLPCDGHVTRT